MSVQAKEIVEKIEDAKTEGAKTEKAYDEPYQPLMSAEVKLIVGSLILGGVLLGFLLWISKAFFAG